MKKLILAFLALATGGLAADPLPVTPFTVVAEVVSFEHYVAARRFVDNYQAAPYGSDDTIVAKIIAPDSLAGREIAIPFETRDRDKEPLARTGTRFRWEHTRNLVDLRNRTDWIFRRALPFPALGIVALGPSGEIIGRYPGSRTELSKR